MTLNPSLIVLDLDRIPPSMALDLRTLYYSGILSGSVLRELASCADLREQRDEEKLMNLLYGESVTV